MGWITVNINKHDQSVVSPPAKDSTLATVVTGIATGLLLASVAVVPNVINSRYQFELQRAATPEAIEAAHSTMFLWSAAFIGTSGAMATALSITAWWMLRRRRR